MNQIQTHSTHIALILRKFKHLHNGNYRYFIGDHDFVFRD